MATLDSVELGELEQRIVDRTAELEVANRKLAHEIAERKHAEDALRESEERFALAARGSSDAMWDWPDVSKDTRWWSPRWRELTGYTVSEMEPNRSNFLTLMHPDDVPRAKEHLRQHFEEHTPYDFEYRLKIKSGEYRWYQSRGQTIWDKDGNPTRMAGSFRDITERKRTEEALKESEERLALALRGSNDAIWDWPDVNKDDQWWSPRRYELLGYTTNEIQSTRSNFIALIHPDDRTRAKDMLREHFEEGKPYDLEYRMKTKSGEYRWYQSRGQAIWDKDGIPTRMAGSARDITERKKVEEALRESDQRFQSLVETGASVIICLSPDHRILEFNREAERLYGRKREDVLGKDYVKLFVPEEFHEAIATDMKLVLQGQLTRGFENPIRTRDGDERTLMWNVNRIEDAFGQPSGIIAVGQDITERKHAEDQLRASHQRLRNLATQLQVVREEERTIIAREVHDEMGQALTALKMDLAWIAKGLPKRWKTLPDRVHSMVSLTDSTLTTVRQLSSRLRPAMLDDLGLEAAIEWQLQDFASRGNYKCRLDLKAKGLIPNEKRDIAVFRIFQEALTNIARHAVASRIVAKLWTKDEELLLMVEDDGKGISDDALTSAYSLGLTGMYERARTLSGRLEIERGAKDRGTVLTLSVPLTSTKHLAQV